MSETAVDQLIRQLGVSLDPELLVLALTHRSFAHEQGGIPTNERLEFLGDTVLGLVVTESLYRAHPGEPEGALAKMRAATVSQRGLAQVARSLNLGRYVLLGRGELATGGRDKDSILSDTLEAVFGAVYLAHGLEVARALIERLVGPTLDAAAHLGAALDWKTSLQELSAAMGLGAPSYEVTGEGPDHFRVFTAHAVVAGEARGVGVGTSKKLAEQEAASSAYRALAEQRAAEQAGSAEQDGPAGQAGSAEHDGSAEQNGSAQQTGPVEQAGSAGPAVAEG